MGATKFLRDYTYYVVYFEESISGLEKGASVKYLGVSCGFVDAIDIAPDGRLVEIVLKLDPTLEINNYVVAQLESAGLAGGKFIQLLLTDEPTSVFELSFTPPHTMIATIQSQLGEIAKSAEEIIRDLQNVKWSEISDGLTGTLSGTNRFMNNDVVKLTEDFHIITKSFIDIITDFSGSSFAENITSTSLSLKNTATQLETFSTNLNYKLDELDVKQYLDMVYLDLKNTLETTNNSVELLSTRLNTTMLGMSLLMEDMQKTSYIINNTLRSINENPYQFLSQPPPKDDIKE